MLQRRLPVSALSAVLAFLRKLAMRVSFSYSRDTFRAKCAFALSSSAPANDQRPLVLRVISDAQCFILLTVPAALTIRCAAKQADSCMHRHEMQHGMLGARW